ncbi:MAG TPA: hypothetical protein VL156_10325 [Terriglobales bacterium]|nr:hypothetical protein [Terriglobales bacterium]
MHEPTKFSRAGVGHYRPELSPRFADLHEGDIKNLIAHLPPEDCLTTILR